MFQLHQIIYGSFLLDDQCIFINALIHSIVSHNLCPIQTTAFRRESNLDVHLQGTGIVAGMRTRVNGCRQIRHTKSFQTLGRKSRRSHSQVKYFRYGSPDRTFIFPGCQMSCYRLRYVPDDWPAPPSNSTTASRSADGGIR